MKHTRILFGVLAVMAIASPAFGLTYLNYEQWGGTSNDVNKTGNDDHNFCWAASASNVLSWAGWGTASDPTAQNIFDEFKEHWWTGSGVSDGTGSTRNAWAWWLNGYGNVNDNRIWKEGSAYVNVAGGGNAWSQYKFEDYYQETSTRSTLMTSLKSYLTGGWGVSLFYDNPDVTKVDHIVTVWGYDYDEAGNVTGLYITDSDDGKSDKQFVPVTYNAGAGYWQRTDGVILSRLYALGRNPNGNSCGGANVTLQNVISAGQTVNCYATSTLTLKPGFHAQAGSAFRGYIQAAGAGSSLLAEMQSVSLTTAMDILSGGAGGSDEHLPVAGNALPESESKPNSVPEPTTLMLLGFGLLSLLAFMRRKRR